MSVCTEDDESGVPGKLLYANLGHVGNGKYIGKGQDVGTGRQASKHMAHPIHCLVLLLARM